MCLPGTIETVRERVEQEGAAEARPPEGVARCGGCRARDGASGGAARRQLDEVEEPAAGPDARVLRKEFPLFLGTTIPTERDVIVTVPANGFYAQRWAFWEHIGTHLDAPAHFVVDGRHSPELTLDELVRPLVVVDISRRGPPRPGCDGAAVRPRRLRAAPRADSTRCRRRHELGLGLARGRHRRVPERRAGRLAALSRLRQGGRRVADRAARHRSDRRRHAQPRSRRGRELRRARDAPDREPLRDREPRQPRPRAATGATIFVGIVPWENGSGGPARVWAQW